MDLPDVEPNYLFSLDMLVQKNQNENNTPVNITYFSI